MGLIETIGRIFRGSGRGGPPGETPGQREMREAGERLMKRGEAERKLKTKKDKKDYGRAHALEILQNIRNLPQGHPLRGITFTPEIVSKNPALAGVLMDLSTMRDLRDDRATYDILLKKLKEVTFVHVELMGSPFATQDEHSLVTLSNRLEERINDIATRAFPDLQMQTRKDELDKAKELPRKRIEPLHDGKGEKTPKPRENIIPLDFSGHYSPLDSNTPIHLKPILEKFHAEVRKEDNMYNDPYDSNQEDIHRSTEKKKAYLKNFQIHLNEFAEQLTTLVSKYGNPDEFTGSERVTIQDVFPYLQQIARYEQAKIIEIDPSQRNPYSNRQLGQRYETAIREAAKNPDLAHRRRVYESIFYPLLERVLRNPSEQWQKTFGLYETEAMNEFYDLISEFEGGQQEVARFTNKMYAIFAGHDAIVIALNPAGDETAWQALSSFARNSYTLDTLEDPIAHQLVNTYERVLWDILKTYDGSIPPELVEPTAQETFIGDSKWDQMVMERFLQKVDSGTVFDALLDRETGRVKRDTKNQVMWDYTTPVRRSHFEGDGKWRLFAAMQQAKGFGLLNSRLIEIFGLQRIPGWKTEDQPEWSDPDKVFASTPYEGMARFVNPAQLITKWKPGSDRFRAYWNIIINEGKEGESHEWWAHDEPKRVFESIIDGSFEEKYPEQAQRFMDKYTWGMFSGRFGPWSTWGVRDAIIGMSDREREYLGGSIRLSYMNNVWATEDVKEFLVEKEFKEKFKAELIRSGRMIYKNDVPDEDWFEKEWFAVGKNQDPHMGIYTADVTKEWNQTKHHAETDELITEVKNVYNALSWIQMAQRSPHIVARNIEIYEDYNGKLRKKSLRDKILEEMFVGLDVEQVFHRGGGYTTHHEEWLRQIGVLEGDIDIIAHAALYDAKGPRNIRLEAGVDEEGHAYESDFDKIVAYRPSQGGITMEVDAGETALRKAKAKEYYRRAKQSIMGNWDERKWMDELGVHYDSDEKGRAGMGKNLIVDWDKVWDRHEHHLKKYNGKTHIQNILDQVKRAAESRVDVAPYFAFDEKLLNKKHRYLLSTEDVVWDKLEIINLGYRQWARRGGDFVGHAKALKEELNYSMNILSVSGELKPIFEAFHKISEAYTEDDKAVAEAKIFMHAQATAKFFKQDWWASKTGLFGKLVALGVNSSIAQEVSNRQAGAAWDSNTLYHFAHQLGVENLLPWKHTEWVSGQHIPNSVHQLEIEVGGTRDHAIWEALSLGLMMAWILTMYSALTAKNEEEEGGGGGGHR